MRAGVVTGGGAWDILAWREDIVLFVESKQHQSSDKLRPTQIAWLGAAVDHGVEPTAFVVAEYTLTRGAARSPSGARSAANQDSSELALVLDEVRGASPMTRIDYRDRVAGFGDEVIGTLELWLEDRQMRRFAIQTLGAMAPSSDVARRLLARAAAGRGADADLADAALRRYQPLRQGRDTAARPSVDIYVASGTPERRIGDCEVVVRGRPCSNPGRHPLANGLVTCTTHRKAFERAIALEAHRRPWTEVEYQRLFSAFPPDGSRPTRVEASAIATELQRTTDAVLWQWTDGARYVMGEAASTTSRALMRWLDGLRRA
jgi:hypothetical protein